jgi:phosphoribosylanthranilate isomerase
MAVAQGASALGLVSAMPSGPGVISEKQIAEIATVVPPGVATFLLTSHIEAESIIAQQRRTLVNTLQLVDKVAEGTHARLRDALPGIALVQVVHVTGEESVDESVAIAPEVDAILLDSGNPTLAVKELGGTGRVHNWELSRRIVDECGKPVFLAGGLRAENVGTAIREVRPYGLDLCSSVRTNGKLDAGKLADFFEAVEHASSLL